MNSSTLKILACLSMLIDHMGYVLFPNLIVFRIIGRLAFPIFCYFIAEGYRKTKDVTDYLGRLFLFALISQLPFMYAFNPRSPYLNVFFTLAMGLYAVYNYDKNKNLYIVILIAIICQVMNTDYGAFGVLMVFFFDRYHDNFKKMAVNVVILTFAMQIISAGMSYFSTPTVYLKQNLIFSLVIEPICLLSLILIKFYNGERGLKLKYLFYAFYPVHLLLLGIIRDLIK